jgi:hypothetical protein
MRNPGAFDALGPDGYLLIIGSVMLLLAIAYSLYALRRESAAVEVRSGAVHLGLIGLTLISLAFYAMLIPIAGYPVATMLFFYVLFRLFGVTSRSLSIVLSLTGAAVFWLLFVRFGNLPMPTGPVGTGW